MKRRIPVLLILLVLLLTALPSVPVLAIDIPDSSPQINAVYVYEGLLEDGDIGVLIDYYLDYAALPTETATEAYFAVFVDTDGVTQLKSTAPYTFVDSGYGRGLVWIYFYPAEVTTYSIDSTDVALYDIWLVGNPTLSWDDGTGNLVDPPKTTASINQWNTTGDMGILLALRVIYYAEQLELIWGPPTVDMVEATALGNRLTAPEGEDYFTNVIPNLQAMAPNCFAASEVEPTLEDIGYSVSFGATATGAIVNGSPVPLGSGSNTITINSIGTFALELEPGTYGSITGGTAAISGGFPSELVPSTNTITVTGAPGTLIMTVALTSTQQTITDTVTGTGFDLTAVAAIFGMSRLLFSSLLWFVITIIICAAPYAWSRREGATISGAVTGGATMLLFTLSLIGGTLLGLLDVRVVAILAIGYGAFIGYVLFFRTSADIGRTIMFMGWMWFIVCLIGGTLAGSVPQASTVLTASIDDSVTTVTVSSTAGFANVGAISIGDERMAYHKKTTAPDTFTGTFWKPLVRGASGTEAVAHSAGATVRSVEGMLLNNSLNYNIALLSDASGLMSFVTIPLVVWDIITSFIFLPLSFLGTDMVILTYIWGIIGLGLLVSVVVALAGGRRV